MGGVVAGRGGVSEGRGEVVLDQVYGEHSSRLVGWFVRRTGDRVLAEDLAQDTFERFAEALDGFDGSRPVWPYLRAVAANVLIDHVRRAERQVVVPGEVVAAGLPDVPVVDEQVVLADLLGRGLEGLSVRQRVAVELQYERGWSVEEAAEFLGVSTLSFRQLSWRARQKLRVWLEQVDDTLQGVVPVGVAVRARWRSWTAKCRDLVSGPVPALSIDAVTTLLIAASVGLAAVAGTNQDGTVPSPAPMSMAAFAEPAGADAKLVATLMGNGREGRRGSATTSLDAQVESDHSVRARTTTVVVPSPTVSSVETDGEVTVQEDDERFYTHRDVEVSVLGLPPIYSRGDALWIECDNVIGDVLCSDGLPLDP